MRPSKINKISVFHNKNQLGIINAKLVFDFH